MAKGRLSTVKEFEEIIVRTASDGGLVKLKDISRIELGAETYNFNADVNDAPAAMIAMSQTSGSNALTSCRAFRRSWNRSGRTCPTI